MKKILLFLAVALMAVACGGRKKATDAADGIAVQGPQLQVVALSDSLISERKADTVAFGRVREGEVVTREVTVRNDDSRAMVITRLNLSCGCVEADYPTQPLRPGEEAPMTLALDTNDLGGRVFKTVVVHTSLSSKPYLLCLTAEIEE